MTRDWLAALPGWRAEPGTDGDVQLLHGSSPNAAGRRDIEAAVVAAFPEYRFADYFAIKGDAFDAMDHVVVAVQQGNGDLLGILAARERVGRAGRFLHTEMNLITAAQQRRGLLLPLWRVLLARLFDGPGGFPELFAIKTYNPMVYSSFRFVARLSGAWLYPQLDGAEPDGRGPSQRQLAADVAATLSPGTPFDPMTGVLRGAGVPRDFYPALPTTNKRDVHDYFARHLEPGDRLLVLVRFGPGSDVERLLRRLGVGTLEQSGTGR